MVLYSGRAALWQWESRCWRRRRYTPFEDVWHRFIFRSFYSVYYSHSYGVSSMKHSSKRDGPWLRNMFFEFQKLARDVQQSVDCTWNARVCRNGFNNYKSACKTVMSFWKGYVYAWTVVDFVIWKNVLLQLIYSAIWFLRSAPPFGWARFS